MNNQRPETTQGTEHEQVSAAWLRVLDLGVPAKAPPRQPLVLRVLAGLAETMP